MIEVKGKNQAVRIYELIAKKDDDISQEKLLQIRNYTQALALYYAGKYQEAQSVFLGNLGDETSSILAQRCQDVLDGKIHISQ